MSEEKVLKEEELEGVSGGKKAPYIIYVVKIGDTLSGIAVKYNTNIGELLRLNKSITNPDNIRVGQEILVPNKK